jgi:hypothetical protein
MLCHPGSPCLKKLPGIQQSEWYRSLLMISVKCCDWHRNASALFCHSRLRLAKIYVCHFCTFVRNVGHSFFFFFYVNDVTITEITRLKSHSQLVCDVLQETNFFGLLVCSVLLYRCDIGRIRSKHGLQAVRYADDQFENSAHSAAVLPIFLTHPT